MSDVNVGDVVVIGETRLTVLAVSGRLLYCQRDGALPSQITVVQREAVDGEHVRVEPRKAAEGVTE